MFGQCVFVRLHTGFIFMAGQSLGWAVFRFCKHRLHISTLLMPSLSEQLSVTAADEDDVPKCTMVHYDPVSWLNHNCKTTSVHIKLVGGDSCLCVTSWDASETSKSEWRIFGQLKSWASISSVLEIVSLSCQHHKQSTCMYKHSLTSLRPLQNLSKTLFMFPPFSMEMTLVWSSSLIQIRKVFSLLCLHKDKLYRVIQYWSPWVRASQGAVDAHSAAPRKGSFIQTQ